MNNYFKRYNTICGWVAFAVAAIVYLMTIEPTASLWDCAEFIATSYKLEIGHPPGAPLFMMISRLFAMLAPGTEYVGMMVNAMSALASAATVMFLFWSITHMGRKIYRKRPEEMTSAQTLTVMGAGLVGALAYAFTDTFWFSAVEGEVYALSSLFTAVVVWAMLRWEEVADEPHSVRWLILIAFLMGLSIGVHILNLVTIPALAFIYYFRKTKKITFKGVLWTMLIGGGLLVLINFIIMPWTVSVGAFVDRMFVNGLGMPVNSGMLVFVFALFALIIAGVWYTHKKGKPLANTILLCFGLIMLGYSSYASVVIRASANPPMNSNDPDNPYGLAYLIGRDQYGSKPIIYGQQYPAPIEDITYDSKYYVEDGKYKKAEVISGYEYAPQFKQFFPRMWSSSPDHIEVYKAWGEIKGKKKINYYGEMIPVPTFGENMRFFFSYQLNLMYWRYFLWNFVGRQSDVQSTGQITDGQWLSGIKPIDELYLGPQDNLPSEMANNKGRNKYYFLPFLLGIVGLIYQLNRDPKNFTIVMWLFVMTGIALVVYFNSYPGEPRERDYVYAGSFYAFCMWLGLGVMCVKDGLARLFKKDNTVMAVAATLICATVPVILIAQNWDDHNRSHRYVARDIGYNYMESTLPNSIIMNYADNDTFPLWFNQEVEEVRPDVRIMNMSYLLGGWYIDQMKQAYNESAPVPFTLPRSKYMYTNEMLEVVEMFQNPDIKSVVDFIASENPASKKRFYDMGMADFVPARNIALPVNKQNAIASGIVKPEDAHLMVDTVYVTLKKNTIDRSEMMLLDLLAHFNWERPLYVTHPSTLYNLGLHEYLQNDGYAYRIVPIKTPMGGDSYGLGRIDVDVMYDNMMHKFRYGNVSDPRVYVDYFTQFSYSAGNIRSNFGRLSKALTDRGQTEKAIEVADRAMQELPMFQFRLNMQIIPIIDAYYYAGAVDKGDVLLRESLERVKEYLSYYLTFPRDKQPLVMDQFGEKYELFERLYYLAYDYQRDDIRLEMQNYMNSLK